MAADDQQLSKIIEQILIAGSQDERQSSLRFDPRVWGGTTTTKTYCKAFFPRQLPSILY